MYDILEALVSIGFLLLIYFGPVSAILESIRGR